jgi:pimeloyl-ACP methyl ester carboxylesterase
VIIAGEAPEHDLWAHDCAALIEALGMAPAWVGGFSAGCRTAVLTAVRQPWAVRGLLLWATSGGAQAARQLGQNYHDEFVAAARRGGMEAVLHTPFFAERVAQNPRNAARLRALRPEEFIATFERWKAAFTPLPLLLGVEDRELAAIAAPTMIIASDERDQMHPPAVSQHVHRLIRGSELWGPLYSSEEYYGGLASPGREAFHRLMAERVAPRLIAFIDGHAGGVDRARSPRG